MRNITAYSIAHRSEKGQGLVEFTLVLPFLLLMVMGIIDFGRILVTYAMASNSVRDALREAVVMGYVNDSSAVPSYRNCDLLRTRASNALFLSPDHISITYIDRDDLMDRSA